jgi:arylsulfatase A-like enzyme
MIDRQVGELVALLKELNLDQNTLLVFSGDNGANDYFASKEHPRGVHSGNKNPQTGFEYRGTKGNLYEGGVRVPFFAYWPGKIAPGRVSEHLCYFPDILPTIAELTGAKAPADTDGISLVPEWFGEATAGRKQPQHEYLYWETAGWSAIRQGNWRAVRPKAKEPWELYDLASDPSESKNVAAAQPEVLAKLAALAEKAHIPAVEGTFTTTDRHERDRRAKIGKHDEAPTATAPKGKGKAAKGKS